MKKIRTALGAIAFVFLIGGVQACGESPTEASAAGDETECYWVNGKIHCID